MEEEKKEASKEASKNAVEVHVNLPTACKEVAEECN